MRRPYLSEIIHNCTHRPDVCLHGIPPPTPGNLWCYPIPSPMEARLEGTRFTGQGIPEVDQVKEVKRLLLRLQDYIVRLEIAMSNLMRVDEGNDLPKTGLVEKGSEIRQAEADRDETHTEMN